MPPPMEDDRLFVRYQVKGEANDEAGSTGVGTERGRDIRFITLEMDGGMDLGQ